MQESCIFLNAFPPPDSLTPPGPNILGWRRGGFHIRPRDCAELRFSVLVGVYGWFVGRVLTPPCSLALLQNVLFTVGADSISARAALPLPQSKIFKKIPSKKEYFGNFYRIYI